MTDQESKKTVEATPPSERHLTAGRFPTKGRQPAYESYTSASLNVRQTPEQFGGVSTD